MNKKIKQLWDNSIEEFSKQHQYATIMLPEPLREKFAELIVRECIDIVKPTQHHEVWAQSYLGGVDGLELLDSRVEKIKQHFGVEE